jgi:hypothetical protein
MARRIIFFNKQQTLSLSLKINQRKIILRLEIEINLMVNSLKLKQIFSFKYQFFNLIDEDLPPLPPRVYKVRLLI